ncbi:hypothetical protein ACF0H5_002972 [Mactra antiquata]
MKALFIFAGLVAFVSVDGKFCAPGDNSAGCEQCPTDRPWIECDIDPCVREAEFGCPLQKENNPNCVSNQCGGCYDEWFLANGKQVWCWGP